MLGSPGTSISVENIGAIDLQSHVDSDKHNISSNSLFQLEGWRFAVKINRDPEHT